MLLLSACGTQNTESTETETAVPDGIKEEKAGELPQIVFSELMSSNKAVLLHDGDFPDWVELYNKGSEDVDLGEIVLSSGNKQYEIPSEILKAGEYKIVFCTGKEETGAPFKLSKNGDEVSLKTADGTEIDRFEIPESESDVSFVRDNEGNITTSRFPTPGFENSSEGYFEMQASIKNDGPLVINEAVVKNKARFKSEKESYDYVEIKNISNNDVSTAGYYLSDSNSDPYKGALPEKTLAPGEIMTVICSDESGAGRYYPAVPFGLDRVRDQVYLTDPEGGFADYLALHDISEGGSCGRVEKENGFFYFPTASPEEENRGGFRAFSEMPVSHTRDGVFKEEGSVTVKLEGKGTVFYTTDGSVPTEESEKYTGPFEVSETTVIRAVNYEEGLAPSRILNLSFIINEGDSLPVVSLIADPDELLGPKGVYEKYLDNSCTASFALYEEDCSCQRDCTVGIHGATSRLYSEKSFELKFNASPEGDLDYDLFGNGVTEFTKILLRNGHEDMLSSKIKDVLCHELCEDMDSTLCVQDSKAASLYINGSYWGIYYIREAHGAEHFARHHGTDPEGVSCFKGENIPEDSSFYELYHYLRSKNPDTDEAYEKIISTVDVDSLLDWIIIEAYFGNIDFYNIRLYYDEATELWYYGLVDLDLTMVSSSDMFNVSMGGDQTYTQLAGKICVNLKIKQKLNKRLDEVLSGALSDEHVLEKIKDLAAEIEPDIEKDGERWGYEKTHWEKKLEGMKEFISRYGGRAALVSSGAKYFNS